MTNRVVKIGDIVTIIGRESMYYEEQGEVVEINDVDGDEDGSIGVRFDKKQMKHFVDHPDECVVRHLDEELRVDDRWSAKTLADRIYGERWHTVRVRTYPFNPSLPCMYKDCACMATGRTIANTWGSIYEVDLCDDHQKELHGMMFDMFPMKENYPFPKVA